MFDRLRRWSQANMPTRETFERIGWLRPIAHRILLPELWHFNRRSVPRGVALGVLVGVLIPIAQTIFAALFALPARANVPVAALTTFITNPLTTPPLWLAAYWLGGRLLHLDAVDAVSRTEAMGWIQWIVSTAGPATALGLLVIAVVGAVVGYVIAAFAWRGWVMHKWRQRALERNLRGL
ncbi:DUF2062 domain-containing protein [Sphingomonas solaris]|uniref:DUF2062 domain-containing protein n=1 Tax=Alterirhizorhabdus solaris TaxID=2529389 RepID=A0A558QTY5_9SPHN|nr:DUF2062 domain-containing protein [Sphingomonas solaris]TVV70594.1 DUF2062 domain-containing protein [Sphingomonas solaris]